MVAKKTPLAKLTWTVREVLEPGTTVHAVHCALGCIFVGGDLLLRVPSGTWEVQARGLPAGLGRPLCVAVEPCAPFRTAVGIDEGDVIVFTDADDGVRITGHQFAAQRGTKQVTSLVWLADGERSLLFANTDDGELLRMQMDRRDQLGWEELQIPRCRAITRDDDGNLGALLVVDGVAKIFLSRDGVTGTLRVVNAGVVLDDTGPACLTLALPALAFSVGDSGPIVSRGAEHAVERPAGLERTTALAFAGDDPRAWLYVGTRREGEHAAGLFVVDAEREVLKVFDFRAEDNRPLDLVSLTWDEARKTALVGSNIGLLAIYPDRPKERAAKKAVVEH